jgi:hypothetical protein
MNRLPDNPPIADELLAWCSDEIDKAAVDLIDEGQLRIHFDDGKLTANFVTNYTIENDGVDDLLHKEFDVLKVCFSMLKKGYDQESLARAFEDAAVAIRAM